MFLQDIDKITNGVRDYIDNKVLPYEIAHKASTEVIAARYVVLNENAGLLRPLLVAAVARDFGVSSSTAEATAKTSSSFENPKTPFSAVELVHAASLISDDIADNSHERRGRPSCHVTFGKRMANLTEHYLVNRAYELLLKDRFSPNLSDEQRVKITGLAAESGIEMVRGQAKDIMQTGLREPKDVIRMYEQKSGALIGLALASGGIIGSASESDVVYLRQLGRCIGVSYQIGDDAFDKRAPSETGKPSNQDLKKQTLVKMVGFEGVIKIKEEKDALVDEIMSKIHGDTSSLKELVMQFRRERDKYLAV